MTRSVHCLFIINTLQNQQESEVFISNIVIDSSIQYQYAGSGRPRVEVAAEFPGLKVHGRSYVIRPLIQHRCTSYTSAASISPAYCLPASPQLCSHL